MHSKPLFFILFLATPAHAADRMPLNDYLQSMDHTQVSFSGYFRSDPDYNSSFYFYNEEGDSFRAIMDAGRETRELVQETCSHRGGYFSLKDLCQITGNGSIEVDGSDLILSIDEVLSHTPPTK